MNRSARNPQYIARQQRALDRWRVCIAGGENPRWPATAEQLDYAKRQAAILVAKLDAVGVRS
jgi:hypothetical protein